jgi:hypothetical protein
MGGVGVQRNTYENSRKSNPYSEAASSYKDDDDDISNYMG